VKLLAIDTSTELCSAALWVDGTLSTRHAWAPRAHGTLILPMVEQLLSTAQLAGTALDAIAFGRGPGAFTGLRLAAAVAQGLGFAWELPLIPISDLLALAARALPPPAPGRVLVCQDARMQEVYWACFDRSAGRAPAAPRLLGAEAVSPAASVSLPGDWVDGAPAGAIRAVGSGFSSSPQLLARLQPYLDEVLADLRPHAREIAVLAAEVGLAGALAPELAEPVYLRDRVTSPP
jgi:tRNA threonylcarbamoyladenosine biosynthesis protein TsaB